MIKKHNNKMEEKIMILPTKKLFYDKYFEWYHSHKETNFSTKINKYFSFQKRWPMEINPDYKQPIVYGIIINTESQKIFAYQRTNKHSENRLDNKRSRWVWWHVDYDNYKNINNILDENIKRELSEEVNLTKNYNLEILWYINDDSDPVWQVHFGVVYIIEVNHEDIKPHSHRELAQWKFYTLEELKNITKKNEVENRSKICMQGIEYYFTKK